LFGGENSENIGILTDCARRNSAEIHRITGFFPFSGYFQISGVEGFQITEQNAFPPIHRCFLFRPNPGGNNAKEKHSSGGAG
jgi:hypothetical protein